MISVDPRTEGVVTYAEWKETAVSAKNSKKPI